MQKQDFTNVLENGYAEIFLKTSTEARALGIHFCINTVGFTSVTLQKMDFEDAFGDFVKQFKTAIFQNTFE